MRTPAVISILMTGALLVTGCVQTRPLHSHAHIGHALTTWHDTPGQQGLFAVAQAELDIAIAAADRVVADRHDPRHARRGLDDVLHALNPDLQPFGPGQDYGAIRALLGAVEHLEYAAGSDDASDNFVASMVDLAALGEQILARLEQAQSVAHESRDRPEPRRLVQLQQTLLAAKFGDPAAAADPALAKGTHGLVHMAAALSHMLDRETDPEYVPVPRRYVLGLVRLPDGRWGYRLPRPERQESGYGY